MFKEDDILRISKLIIDDPYYGKVGSLVRFYKYMSNNSIEVKLLLPKENEISLRYVAGTSFFEKL